MNELDLEDLETRLYSQVYHGFDEKLEQDSTQPYSGTNSLSKPTNDMRRPGVRYFGPWSPAAKFQKYTNNKQTRKDTSQPNGSYAKNTGKSRKSEIAINQVVVVSSKRPVHYSNSKQRNRLKWRVKQQHKNNYKQLEKIQNVTMVSEQEGVNSKENSVITVSDSEDDSCVLIDNNWPVLSVVDSDDDSKEISPHRQHEVVNGDATLNTKTVELLNESLTDDVIFIEPIVAPIETINIDEESENLRKYNIDTGPSVSSRISIHKSLNKDHTINLQKERKELLSTPDSTSNDFLNHAGVELNRKNFNFSLHGVDFDNGDFAKPAPKSNETFETESSSSTTDPNIVNLMKTAVFNEIDFPKDDIFADNNLECFGNFITPLRNNMAPVNTQSSPIQKKNIYSSGCSSESELDESVTNKSKDFTQKVKQLPELSPIRSSTHDANSEACTLQVSKKLRKTNSIGSKYDLLNPKISDLPCKELKAKNTKKKKKKKRSESNESRESFIAPVETDADNNVKRKKRRSSFMESENNQIKKPTSEMNNLAQEAKSTASLTSGLVNSNLQTGEINDEIQSSDIKNSGKSIATYTESATCEVISVAPASNELNLIENVKTSEVSRNLQIPANDNVKDILKPDSLLKNDLSNPSLNVSINETNHNETSMISSDSESVLSPLAEHSDIQLNCESFHINKNVSSSVECMDNSIHFDVQELQSKMSDDPNIWHILDSDKWPRSKSRGRRCTRCKQFGHGAIRCSTKIEPKCTLCGEAGHYEPRCSKKICTQCGQRSSYSTNYCGSCFKYRNNQCRICSLRGHTSNTCPDLWRRYCLTTGEGPINRYDGPQFKDKSRLWCSGCAESGHLEHMCDFYTSIYPPADPFIKSFEDIHDKPRTSRYGSECREPPFYEPPESLSYHGGRRVFHEYDQRVNSQNNYGHMTHEFVNPYTDGIFIAGQQNFFRQMDPNAVHYPQNTYSGDHDHFGFNSVSPNFVNFTTDVHPPNSYPKLPMLDHKFVTKSIKRNNSIFFNMPCFKLQHFINEELHRLSKLSLLAKNLVQELKKRQVPGQCDTTEKAEYFERLNMILFGVFNLSDGKKHLQRLKRFKRGKHKLDNIARRLLQTSYCYIFGNDKHKNVHYDELLRNI